MYNIFRTASNTDLCLRHLVLMVDVGSCLQQSLNCLSIPHYEQLSPEEHCHTVWEYERQVKLFVCLIPRLHPQERAFVTKETSINRVSYIHTIKFLRQFFDTVYVNSINATSPSCLIIYRDWPLSLPTCQMYLQRKLHSHLQLDGPQQFYHF